MSRARNEVIAGDYKGGAIVSILGEVSISKNPIGSLFLTMDTVESYEVITHEHLKNKRAQYVAIQFRDGKKSLLELDYDLCVMLIKNCLDKAAARCGATPESTKLCNPNSKEFCRDCPCFRCIVWPKCCNRRIQDRRVKYRNDLN